MTTLNVKFPEGLINLVNPKDVKVLGHGNIYEAAEKEAGKEYLIYREHNLIESTNCFNVSKEYVKQRGLKVSDKIAFVEYPLINGRRMIDIFKIINK